MLAAHRRGARTETVRFARAWDGFGRRAGRGPRRATPRELRILTRLLEASSASEQGEVDLAAAITEHRAARARHACENESDGFGEIRVRVGWNWLLSPRRCEELQRAVERAGAPFG